MINIPLSAVIIILLIMIMILPVTALAPGTVKPPSMAPQPLTDITLAKPFSRSYYNTVNPSSPYYNPGDSRGLTDTRLSPLIRGTGSIPISLNAGSQTNSLIKDSWGTIIKDDIWTGRQISYLRACHNFHSSLEIPPGATLYHTTLHPNFCPIEILSRYYWDEAGKMRRCISIFDHGKRQPDHPFVVNLDGENIRPYLNDDWYCLEIYQWRDPDQQEPDTWVALLYNWDIEQWEILYQTQGWMNQQFGWDIWEATNFDDSPWPDLGDFIFSTYNLSIGFYTDNNDYLITHEYGWPQEGLRNSCRYSRTHFEDYYWWELGANGIPEKPETGPKIISTIR